MEILLNVISIIYRNLIRYIALFILVGLLLISLISISFITDEEVVLFLSNNIFTFIGVFAAIVAIIFISQSSFWKKLAVILENDKNWHTIKHTYYIILLALGITWVLITQFIPEADQMDIQNIVCQLSEHNYESLTNGGYLYRCTNQIGLTMICYIFSYIFGQRNYILFQLTNALAIVMIYKCISDILQHFGCKRTTQLLYLCCSVIFSPLIIYTSFVYGTIWGLMFSVIAFKSQIRFFSTYEKKYMLESSLCIAIATIVKSNFLVLCIALLMCAAVQCKKDKFLQHSIYILCVIASVLILNTSASLLLTAISGYKLNQGYSPLAYIAMGLSESWRGPGWYTSLLSRLYTDADCQTGKQSLLALNEIRDRFDIFINDRTYTFRFFTRKIASQWNEPTFQSLWGFINADSNIIQPPFVTNLFTHSSEAIYSYFFNIYQSIIYLGATIWLILCKKEDFNKQSIFILSLVGGFIFHLFWEAKSQYTLMYFVMLTPCALMGYEKLISFIKFQKQHTVNRKIGGRLLVTLMLIVLFTSLYLYDKTDCLRTDDEYYNLYLTGIDDN